MTPPLVILGPLALTSWDLLLIALVTAMGTLLAYLPHPQAKAFVMMLPVPFTLATLSLGYPVHIAHILGLFLLLGYTYGVYWLHTRRRFPIIGAILVCAVGYCGAAAFLAPRLPQSEAAFWSAVGLVFICGLLLRVCLPERHEPAYRSPLPIYLKAPLMALIVTALVLLKQHLQGFMALFPMMGVIASYEARHSLWTMTRQIPLIMLTLTPMMATIHFLQASWGIGPALLAGWAIYLFALLFCHPRRR